MSEWRTGRTPDRRLTVVQAADVLGITPEAVRGRIRRGTLRAEREAGRVYVVLDADQQRPTADQPIGQPDALAAELRDRVRYLESIISTRDDEIRRRDVIISQLTDRIPALEAPPEPPESPVPPGPSDYSPTEASGERQTPTSRPWWRRWLE